ncbi:hypothetical protein [Peribacillus phoenicis]|uniref:hypothetical protein n=2 Tax=unclassified Peribacillus TaxID=2675266 RepID=UPI0039A6C693
MNEYDTVEVITMTNKQKKDYIGIVIPSCHKESALKAECMEQSKSPFLKYSLPINKGFSEADDTNCCALINEPGSHIKLLLSPLKSNKIKLHSIPGSDEFSQRGKAS